METVYLKVSISSGVLCVDAASKYFFIIFQQLSVIFVMVKKSQHADLQCNSYLTSDLLIFREQREREKQQKLEQEREEKRRRQQEEEKKRKEEEEKRRKAEKEKAAKKVKLLLIKDWEWIQLPPVPERPISANPGIKILLYFCIYLP